MNGKVLKLIEEIGGIMSYDIPDDFDYFDAERKSVITDDDLQEIATGREFLSRDLRRVCLLLDLISAEAEAIESRANMKYIKNKERI